MPARYNPFPQYKCKQIARDVSQLLNLCPGLEWRQVKEYYEPRLPGMEEPFVKVYDDETRLMIVRALDRELRYQHARRP